MITLIIIIFYFSLGESQRTEASNQSQSQEGIRWRNLAVTITDRNQSKSVPHFLLHPSTGFVEKGKLCAILGPSGEYHPNDSSLFLDAPIIYLSGYRSWKKYFTCSSQWYNFKKPWEASMGSCLVRGRIRYRRTEC
jgi:hypothetical protein